MPGIHIHVHVYVYNNLIAHTGVKVILVPRKRGPTDRQGVRYPPYIEVTQLKALLQIARILRCRQLSPRGVVAEAVACKLGGIQFESRLFSIFFQVA